MNTISAHAAFGTRRRITTLSLVLGIAFAKVGLVMHTFMELHHAPLPLRLVCLLWLIAVLAVLLATYAGVLTL